MNDASLTQEMADSYRSHESQTAARPALSVIILSWNTRDLLRDCLTSVIGEAAGLETEIIVADNASSDGSVEMVRETFPNVRIIENKTNLGFAVANNRVFPLCRSDKILLLNSDTIVKPQALQIMVDFLDQHPDVGVVGPKLIHPHARLDVLGCGEQI